MYDRYAITAELHRRGSSHAAVGRKLGYTTRMVGYVISGERNNPRIRREVARVVGKPVATLWPAHTETRTAA